MIDRSHPIFFHSSDTSSLSLISEKLTRSDIYDFWSRAMHIFLSAKNKLGFIDETCAKENFEPSLHKVWERCNAFVFAWIMNSVS